MEVREGMSEVVLTIGPGHTLREAADAMCQRNVGAAVVLDPEAPGPGVITERDILRSVAEGDDPDSERVSDHLTKDLTFAAPEQVTPGRKVSFEGRLVAHGPGYAARVGVSPEEGAAQLDRQRYHVEVPFGALRFG